MREDYIKWLKRHHKKYGLDNALNIQLLEEAPDEILLQFKKHFERGEVRLSALEDTKLLKAHILGLIRRDESYDFLYSCLQKTGKDPLEKRYCQDVMRFLMLSLWIDTGRFHVFHRLNLFEKGQMRAYLKGKDELIRSIEVNLHKLTVEYKGSLIHNLQRQNTKSKDMFVVGLAHMQAEKETTELLHLYGSITKTVTGILKGQEDETFFNSTPYDRENNYLLSRQAGSKTGIRNLCIRYIACILQVCGVEYTGTIIYKLAGFLIPIEYQGGLIENDIYKIISGVNIKDESQNYLETFDGIFGVITPNFTGKYVGDWDKATRNEREPNIKLEDTELFPIFKKWYNENLSFVKYAAFVRQQRLKNGINIEYPFIFDAPPKE